MGILIPLYTYPTDATWAEVLLQKTLHPSASITAIINPDNGAGASSDANYIRGVKAFQLAGITVLGYVATGYGNRTLSAIDAECKRYAAWYSVDGIFFDEYQSGWSAPPISGISLGNPGTDATGNIPLVTYEQAGMPQMGFSGNYIAHSVDALPSIYSRPAYYYITDDRASYQVLPTYFASLVAGDIENSPVTPRPPSQGKMSLTIDGKTYSWNIESL